ncbi:MAG: TerB family tellurite resistance protein [Gemmatimonadaceae bacterium]|nr:TerB family tellurite resistance protein [Gemmatimonadaceae bacterium]
MILDAIRSLLQGRTAETRADPASTAPIDPVHVAACALLLDIAHADREFSASERAHLEDVLARHFSLNPEAGKALIDICQQERAHAVDHFQFTRVLRENYDVGQKMVLAEIMWGLVLADGQIAEHEHYLTRKIANLLELEPGYLSTAKTRAEHRSG